jgi:DNA-directed RNA polymerase specialized sigma24 family protein
MSADTGQVSEPCEECNREADESAGIVVARYPLPDGDFGIRCNECFAEILAEETLLSQQEAEFAAAYLAGLSYYDAGELVGIPKQNTGTIGNHVREKREKAFEQMEQAANTIEVLQHW